MADRGRLFYASDGLLWEVDPNADISGEPAQADLQPVRMGELAAEVLELDQQADDGTDRVFIRGSDGAIKAEVFFDGTNTVINPLAGSVDVQGALATESTDITTSGGLTYTTLVSRTGLSFTGGETNPNALGTLLPLSDMPIVVTAVPANDPDNDHGYNVDSIWWDDSGPGLRVRVSETENAGGGQADIYAWKINP